MRDVGAEMQIQFGQKELRVEQTTNAEERGLTLRRRHTWIHIHEPQETYLNFIASTNGICRSSEAS